MTTTEQTPVTAVPDAGVPRAAVYRPAARAAAVILPLGAVLAAVSTLFDPPRRSPSRGACTSRTAPNRRVPRSRRRSCTTGSPRWASAVVMAGAQALGPFGFLAGVALLLAYGLITGYALWRAPAVR